MTQHQKIIAYMLRRYPDKIWFKYQDFQSPDTPRKFFVGYKTSARVNELEKESDSLFDSRIAPNDSKNRREIRLSFRNIDKIREELSPDRVDFIEAKARKYNVDLDEAGKKQSPLI